MTGNYCYNCFTMRAGVGPCPHCGYDPEWDRGRHPNALPHGSILAGRYITGRVLGQGGFGVTYVALDRPTDKKMAIKEYLPVSAAYRMAGGVQVSANAETGGRSFSYGLDRFLEEAETLAKFSGTPGIVAVCSFFRENGTAYFVMDYVEGVSFKVYLRSHEGRVGWQEAVDILQPVMRALETVHQAGVVHRDVAPDNIYITGGGGVKLLDFGAARYSLGDKSRSLDVILRPGYAPREQYLSRSRQGPFTDVYSLAACFYAAITGYLPQEALERAERDELVPFSRHGVYLPPKLETAIYKGLAVDAADRYQTMEAFLAAVEEAVPVPVPPSMPEQPPNMNQMSHAVVHQELPTPPSASGPAPPKAGLAARLADIFRPKRSGTETLYRDACAAYGSGDYQTAVRLFHQAARAGDNRAKYSLSECFRRGNGVPQSAESAFRWCLAAAKNGNEDAWYTVGCCYYTGDGVAVNISEAVRWLEKSAASQSGAATAARRMLEALRADGR